MTRAEAAALLGIPVDADRATAQRAYLRLARHAHPDAAPGAGEDSRRAAALRFDALSRARAEFDRPGDARPDAAGPGTRGPSVPSAWMRQPSAGIGNALLLLVLLVFLLVALVTLDDAIRTHGFETGAPPASVLRVA